MSFYLNEPYLIAYLTKGICQLLKLMHPRTESRFISHMLKPIIIKTNVPLSSVHIQNIIFECINCFFRSGNGGAAPFVFDYSKRK